MTERQPPARPGPVRLTTAESILALPRQTKRLIMSTTDAVAIPLAFWGALALKFDRLDPGLARTSAYFLVALSSALFFFAVFGLYRTVIRFIGPRATVTVFAGVTLSAVALAVLLVGGSRFAARYIFQRASGTGKTAARVAIYGAGDAGAHACAVLLGTADYEPVVFIDDKKSLQGSSINGVRVYGSDSLARLVHERRIDRILLAMPATTRRRRRDILAALEPLGVHVQSLPNLADLLAGKAQISELCDVDVSDLLGRDPVPPKQKLFGSCIRGKCVLVTGAGGSIGSELCRQIMRLSPSRLVLFEMS